MNIEVKGVSTLLVVKKSSSKKEFKNPIALSADVSTLTPKEQCD
jgi:hypothetical protein